MTYFVKHCKDVTESTSRQLSYIIHLNSCCLAKIHSTAPLFKISKSYAATTESSVAVSGVLSPLQRDQRRMK